MKADELQALIDPLMNTRKKKVPFQVRAGSTTLGFIRIGKVWRMMYKDMQSDGTAVRVIEDTLLTGHLLLAIGDRKGSEFLPRAWIRLRMDAEYSVHPMEVGL